MTIEHPEVIEASAARRERVKKIKTLSVLMFGKSNWHTLTEAEQTLFLHTLETSPPGLFI